MAEVLIDRGAITLLVAMTGAGAATVVVCLGGDADAALAAAVGIFGLINVDGAAGAEAASGSGFDVDFDFVDDEDLAGSEIGHDGPEYGYRGRHDGDVDFEDGEDVDEWDVVGHVEDWDGASAIDRQGYHAADGGCTNNASEGVQRY